MSDQKVMSWVHARKGRITGLSVGGDEEWLDIELVEDHGLRYFSESNRGRVDGRGEIIRVQRSLLTEVGTVTGEYAALIAEARGSYRSLDGLVCVSPGLLARLADALEAVTAEPEWYYRARWGRKESHWFALSKSYVAKFLAEGYEVQRTPACPWLPVEGESA